MAEEVVVPEAKPRVFATGPGWLPEGLRFDPILFAVG